MASGGLSCGPRREPGCTPAVNTWFCYTTFTEWAADCGESRINAGVHFQESVNASILVCPQIGNLTLNAYNSYWFNTATAPLDPLERDVYFA